MTNQSTGDLAGHPGDLRALDAEVAEKVMGMQWRRSALAPHGYSGARGELLAPWRWLVSSMVKFEPARGDETPWLENLPRYSSDVASAFLVVEKMREKGYRPLINTSAREGEWHCAMALDDDYIHAYGDTAPHAICLAALAALTASLPEKAQFGASVGVTTDADSQEAK